AHPACACAGCCQTCSTSSTVSLNSDANPVPQESLLRRRRIRAASSGHYSPTPNAVHRPGRTHGRPPRLAVLRRSPTDSLSARGGRTTIRRSVDQTKGPGDPTVRAGSPRPSLRAHRRPQSHHPKDGSGTAVAMHLHTLTRRYDFLTFIGERL